MCHSGWLTGLVVLPSLWFGYFISLALPQVSPANAEAILAARAAGLKVFLATGRARSGPWVKECLVPLSLEAPGVFTQGLTSFDEGNRYATQRSDPGLTAPRQSPG